MTTIFAVTACGDDSAGTGGGGGSSSGTDGSGGSTVAGSPTSTVTGSTGASPVGPVTASTGGGCVAEVFADPEVNACGEDNCCTAMQACLADPASCFNADNQLDETLPNGEALLTCMEDNSCFGDSTFAIYCESGIGFDLAAIEEANGAEAAAEVEAEVACFNESGCCEFFDICTDGGTDTEGCIACLNGEASDYSRCEEAHDCSVQAGCGGLVFVPTCDSGLGVSSIEVGECLNDNCCDAYNECTDNGSETGIQDCLDCLNTEGGGDLCNAAIACGDTNCNTSICDSGVTIDNLELAECLTTSCCTEYTECTNGGEDEADVQLCIDCFNAAAVEGAEPGALCADAIACEELNCDEGAGGGGTGGAPGTGGGGGAGGA